MKICFWGTIAEALNGRTPGGAELQIALMAKALAKSGNEVVVLDYSISADFITQEGVNVIALRGWNEGIKILRNLTHRLPVLYKSLINQKADLYVCRMRDFRHIVVYFAARRLGSKFIYSLASDLETLSFFLRCKFDYFTSIGRLWWLFDIFSTEIVHSFLLRKSDFIFVQHEGQKINLSKKKIKSIVFFNLIGKTKIFNSLNPIRKDIIYVGSLSKKKGIIELFQIINKAPRSTFKIVGEPRDSVGLYYYEKLKLLKNVTLFGRLKHSDMMNEMFDSKALISTSRFEGFPNVFIEAWLCGIPVLSLYVNPGNVLTNESIGYIADGQIDKMLYNISCLGEIEEISYLSHNYVKYYHFVNNRKISEINQLFNSL